jgi:hypothetical protein
MFKGVGADGGEGADWGQSMLCEHKASICAIDVHHGANLMVTAENNGTTYDIRGLYTHIHIHTHIHTHTYTYTHTYTHTHTHKSSNGDRHTEQSEGARCR